MTPEELKALLAAASNPDTSADALVTLSDKVTGLITTLDEGKKQKATDDATIAQLRDTNTRLFLRVTGTTDTSQQEEATPISEMNRDQLKALFANKMKEAQNG